jgi:hypothetical protein
MKDLYDPPAIVRADVGSLITEIKAARDELKTCMTRGAELVLQLGKLCIQLQSAVGPGNWVETVSHLDVSVRTVQRWMRLARMSPVDGDLDEVWRIICGKYDADDDEDTTPVSHGDEEDEVVDATPVSHGDREEEPSPNSTGGSADTNGDRKVEGKRSSREPGDEDDMPGNPYMPTLYRCQKSLSKQHKEMIRRQEVSTQDASKLNDRMEDYSRQYEHCAIRPERPIRPPRKGTCKYCQAEVLWCTTPNHKNVALVESSSFAAKQPGHRGGRWDIDGNVAVPAPGGRYRLHFLLCPKKDSKSEVSEVPLPE